MALSGGYPDEYVSEMTFHSNVDTESSDDQYRLGLRFHLHRMRRPRFKRNQTKSKNLRTAPQTSHQSFDNPLNAALKVSF